MAIFPALAETRSAPAFAWALSILALPQPELARSSSCCAPTLAITEPPSSTVLTSHHCLMCEKTTRYFFGSIQSKRRDAISSLVTATMTD
ncbi:uncharacterized protein B0T23DRAFT_8759 [Neurospora hispaniola]|uniref:Uncharacterized protein n=1 Tax=Neurospora hispaniola TaxID=588809 RepID=A0AAJ0IF07_9PEZI|nr:hypothetical protein B0T23DRAFT_8759 [Neurospora hispaniola]